MSNVRSANSTLTISPSDAMSSCKTKAEVRGARRGRCPPPPRTQNGTERGVRLDDDDDDYDDDGSIAAATSRDHGVRHARKHAHGSTIDRVEGEREASSAS